MAKSTSAAASNASKKNKEKNTSVSLTGGKARNMNQSGTLTRSAHQEEQKKKKEGHISYQASTLLCCCLAKIIEHGQGDILHSVSAVMLICTSHRYYLVLMMNLCDSCFLYDLPPAGGNNTN